MPAAEKIRDMQTKGLGCKAFKIKCRGFVNIEASAAPDVPRAKKRWDGPAH